MTYIDNDNKWCGQYIESVELVMGNNSDEIITNLGTYCEKTYNIVSGLPMPIQLTEFEPVLTDGYVAFEVPKLKEISF